MAYKLNVTEYADGLYSCFSLKADIVNVVGIFHQLETYQRKMQDG